MATSTHSTFKIKIQHAPRGRWRAIGGEYPSYYTAWNATYRLFREAGLDHDAYSYHAAIMVIESQQAG